MVKHGGNIYNTGLSPDSIIDFSSNINEFGIRSRYAFYPETYYGKYEKKIADYAGVGAGNIVIGPGLNYFIARFFDFYSIRYPLIIKPAFSEYEKAALDRKLEYSTLKLDIVKRNAGIVRNYRYDAMFIVTPNNPTGEIVDTEIIEDLCRVSAGKNSYIFIDSAFGDFVPEYSEKLAEIALKNPNVLLGRSLTKIFAMPSLRLGYLISSEANIMNFKNLMETWSVCQPALDFISGIDMDHVRDQAIENTERERHFMISGLAKLGLQIIGEPVANYVSFSIEDPEDLEKFANQRGILVRVLDDFPELGGRAVRVSIKRRKKNELLLRTVADFLKTHEDKYR